MLLNPTRDPEVHRVTSTLPEARGPITERPFSSLRRDPHDLHWAPDVEGASDDNLQLAPYCCYELHYRGWCGVHTDWEWEPSLLGARRLLEIQKHLEAQDAEITRLVVAVCTPT